MKAKKGDLSLADIQARHYKGSRKFKFNIPPLDQPLTLKINQDPRDFLKHAKEPYYSIHGGNDAKYYTQKTAYHYRRQSNIPKRELHIINASIRDIKKAIESGITPAYEARKVGSNREVLMGSENNSEIVRNRDIKYFDFNLKKGLGRYTGVYEVDLNKAYWNVALDLGYISHETYKKGLTAQKSTRLASLGAAAKVTYHYRFDGERENYVKKNRRETAPAFFHICYTLGQIMADVFNNYADFIFGYYVDAFFLDAVACWDVEDYIGQLGHSAKVIPLDWIDVYPDKIEALESGKTEGQKKVYYRIPHRARAARRYAELERLRRIQGS